MKDIIKASINEEMQAMKNLLQLLENQHSYLVTQDVFGMDSITKKVETACRDIAKAEVNRKRVLQGKTLREIVNDLHDEETTSLYETLIKCVDACTVQKDVNETLIRQSLSYTNSMLTMLRPRGEAKTYNGYGAVKR